MNGPLKNPVISDASARTLCKILRIAEKVFGQHPLRIWRKQRRMTLEQVSEMTGVSHATLSRIENGKNEPSLTLAAHLSEITGIDAAKFSGWRKVA